MIRYAFFKDGPGLVYLRMGGWRRRQSGEHKQHGEHSRVPIFAEKTSLRKRTLPARSQPRAVERLGSGRMEPEREGRSVSFFQPPTKPRKAALNEEQERGNAAKHVFDYASPTLQCKVLPALADDPDLPNPSVYRQTHVRFRVVI